MLGPEASQPQVQWEETDRVLVGQSLSKVVSNPSLPVQGQAQTSTNSWRAPLHIRQVTAKGGVQSQPESTPGGSMPSPEDNTIKFSDLLPSLVISNQKLR